MNTNSPQARFLTSTIRRDQLDTAAAAEQQQYLCTVEVQITVTVESEATAVDRSYEIVDEALSVLSQTPRWAAQGGGRFVANTTSATLGGFPA